MVHSEKMDFQIKENIRVNRIKSQNIKLSVDGADIQTFKMKGFLGSGWILTSTVIQLPVITHKNVGGERYN